jgi:signal transduction histidine kinase
MKRAGGRLARLVAGLVLGFGLIAPAIAAPNSGSAFAARIESARKQMLVDPAAARDLAQDAMKAANSTLNGRDRILNMAEAEAVACQAYIRLGDIDVASKLADSALARISKLDAPEKLTGDLLLSSGQIATRRNDVQAALGNFQRAYRLFQGIGERRWQAIALQSIAQLYMRANDIEAALKYYQQSDDEYAGDPQFSLSNHNNRGNALLKRGKPDDAERQFTEALDFARQIGSQKYVALILANIAQAQINQGKAVEARETIVQAAAITNENDMWGIWNLRAQVAYLTRDYASASKSIDMAIARMNAEAAPGLYLQVHETAYKIFRSTGRDALALKHLEEMSRIYEADAKLTASTNAALMAARFDFANQDLKISQLKAAQLEKTVAFERARAKLQRNLLIVIVTGSILVGGLLVTGLIMITRSRNRERAAKLVLADTNRELEKAIAAKMEFLATTSHEIRTPLNGILGMTQVMLSDRALTATLRDRIGIVHSAGENMRILVDDILDVAKMETGKLAVGTGTIELKATLRQVAQVWRLQAEAAGIGLVLHLDDCPERVEGDGGRLRQIVFNLLSNAMKFTEKGKVELIATAEGDRLRISVRDSGIGIARDWHESIFELFQQVDGGTTRQYGGTGLGLAICRNLARAMGGDVTVESETGFGSTFTIDLPLVVSAETLPQSTGNARPNSVLVIERNPLTRGILRAVLSERFAVVNFAGSAEEAADILAHGDTDWIVADSASVDSWDVIDGNVPTILIEGTATAPAALHAVMRTVLTKPISKSALLAAFADAPIPVAEAA